jgi:hypothetical protein
LARDVMTAVVQMTRIFCKEPLAKHKLSASFNHDHERVEQDDIDLSLLFEPIPFRPDEVGGGKFLVFLCTRRG